MSKVNKSKVVRYNKWGYIFLAPFFIVYFVFSLVPLISTFYNSFFENFLSGLKQVGPNFVGFDNFVKIFQQGDLLKYAGNTCIIWLLGFIPQILVSLLLAAWFTDVRLRIKGAGFFKTVIYMPNLIMATAMAMLFFTMFSDGGPINDILVNIGLLDEPYRFTTEMAGNRGLIAFMNFLMWFGNTTIMLMAAMMGVDTSLVEAAEVDGAKHFQIFRFITMPLIKPILVYTVITSLIGGVQMFDLPQIFTNGYGNPNHTSTTLIMYLNEHIATSKNYGMAGALSVILFIFTAVLSLVVYHVLTKKED